MASISEAMLTKETESAQRKLEEMLAEINLSLREAMRQLVRHLRKSTDSARRWHPKGL